MLHYPSFNPVAFSLGPLAVHWYGLMYLLGFLLAWSLAWLRRHHFDPAWTAEQLADLIFYTALGLILGGRIGYMLFYDWAQLLHHPLDLFKIWQGGMSFHGGLLGGLVALLIYARIHKRDWARVLDFVAPLIPLGLAAGRLGNFINGELWGRVTKVPWAMIDPNGDGLPRHPSQLYELFLEGTLLFIVLWVFTRKARPRFAPSALFLLCYGLVRFGVEFYRQPDPQLGFVAFGWMTMGQCLSIPMILAGVVALIWTYHRQAQGAST